MNLSAKTEYACIAVLELAARHEAREPVRIREIAEAHGVPSRFLVQILLQLKGAGLVTSTRGAAGGYQLARPPQEITLGEVLGVIEGPGGALKSNATQATPVTRVLLDNWKRALAAERKLLSEITFADLVQQLRDHSGGMYYI